MELPAVEEVENLHHHKRVEDEGEVPRVDAEFFEYYLVVFLAVQVVESTAAHCAPLHDTVFVFIIKFAKELIAVITTWVLGDEAIGQEHQHKHNC